MKKQLQIGYDFGSRLKQRFIWFTSRPYWHNSRSKCSISCFISKTWYIIWKTWVKQSFPITHIDASWFTGNSPVTWFQQSWFPLMWIPLTWFQLKWFSLSWFQNMISLTWFENMISASVISTNMIYTNAISTKAGYANTFFFFFTVIRLQQQWKWIHSGIITKKKPIQRWNQFKTNYKFFKIIVKVQKSFNQLVKYWGVYWDYVNRYQWDDRRFKSVGQSTSSHVRQRHA